jgi:opacity protein-like surface antigen
VCLCCVLALANPAPGSVLGLNIAYKSSLDDLVKDIYGTGSITLGAAFSFHFAWRIEMRFEGDYSYKKGSLSITDEKISLSTKMAFWGGRLRILEKHKFCPYIGGGIGILWYTENFPDRFKDVSGREEGILHGEAGTYIDLNEKWRMDLNIRYVKAKIQPYIDSINLGGISLGVGIGYRF